jgi:hypothetical protein
MLLAPGARERTAAECKRLFTMPGLRLSRIALLLQGSQDQVPDARGDPAVEAGNHTLPRAVALGQVAPWGAGGVEPEHGINHLAVIAGGPSALRLLRRQQGRRSVPLDVG